MNTILETVAGMIRGKQQQTKTKAAAVSPAVAAALEAKRAVLAAAEKEVRQLARSLEPKESAAATASKLRMMGLKKAEAKKPPVVEPEPEPEPEPESESEQDEEMEDAADEEEQDAEDNDDADEAVEEKEEEEKESAAAEDDDDDDEQVDQNASQPIVPDEKLDDAKAAAIADIDVAAAPGQPAVVVAAEPDVAAEAPVVVAAAAAAAAAVEAKEPAPKADVAMRVEQEAAPAAESPSAVKPAAVLALPLRSTAAILGTTATGRMVFPKRHRGARGGVKMGRNGRILPTAAVKNLLLRNGFLRSTDTAVAMSTTAVTAIVEQLVRCIAMVTDGSRRQCVMMRDFKEGLRAALMPAGIDGSSYA